MNITVSAYNRPVYLAQTLAALAECRGVEHCRVAVLLDPCDQTQEQANIAAKHGFEPVVYSNRVGCNLAILGAMQYGFSILGGDYHIHLEDDTVPCRDALRWFAWARDAYRDDPRIMNVSGYQRVSNGRTAQCGARCWFTPWGWATWRNRWIGLEAGWAKGDAVSWDVVVNHVLRAGRYEAFPTVSRIQNIGAEMGTHVPNAEWHTANHRVPVTSDDIEDVSVTEWCHVRDDAHADHA